MTENEKIEAEELRFIYELILDGWSDSDILNKYISLKDSGDLNFPLRSEETFIKDRRKEMKIASEVLRASISKIIGKYAPKREDEHFAQIAEVSAILLQDNLNTVTIVRNVNEVTRGLSSKYVYSYEYQIIGRNNIPIRLNRLKLIRIFTKNVDEAIKRHGLSFFHDCYVPHLKAIMGKEMDNTGGFWPTVEVKPFEVIKAVKDIVNSKHLQGTCSLCKLENQLLTCPQVGIHLHS